MGIRKLDNIIFKLKLILVITNEVVIFAVTMSIFLAVGLVVFGFDIVGLIMVIIGHCIIYRFKFKKYINQIEPEKRKIIESINILKQRKLNRQ